jgi:hypothetical protein
MPLGLPVEPDEYIQNAIPSRCVSAGARVDGNAGSHDVALSVSTGEAPPCSPFTTISVFRAVLAQATTLNLSAQSASATATVAPESAR